MRHYWKSFTKRLMCGVLAVTLVINGGNDFAFAKGIAENSTNDVDGAIEATVNAEVYFTVSSSGRVITLDGIVENPIDCRDIITEESVPDNAKYRIYYGEFEGKEVVNFACDASNTSWKADHDRVFQIPKRTNPAGWEAVTIVPQGDGTVAFKGNANGKYFTVNEFKLELTSDKEVSSNEKFIIYTDTAPKSARKVTLSEVAGDSVKVSWEGVTQTLYSGYQVLYSKTEDGDYVVAGETANTFLTVDNLELNTKYYFKVRTITNHDGGPYSDSAIAYTTTLREYKPSAPKNLTISSYTGDAVKLQWSESTSATGYEIYRAKSRFSQYSKIGEVTNSTTYTDNNPNKSKYENYYKVKAINSVDSSEFSNAISLEIEMFGENMYVFSEEDNLDQINRVVANVFEKQHYNQFGKERYALAYKPGDYTDGDTLEIGYYTHLLGLGETPDDVKLTNVRTPAALSDNNATCNFWVAIENVGIADLDNNEDPYYNFQWAVSQAAPARRLYVERQAVFDWYYGWASGGYVADSYFEKAAGSYSQQQYYYRNCYVNGGTYGVNWNQVIQGCQGNTVDTSSMVPLKNNNGVTNWNQRSSTTVINNTPQIREKPFLYFDVESDEYKVFVPAMRKEAIGISWTEEYIGDGISLSVDKYFYIAKPEKDNADTINRKLAEGKNIIFSPGVYRVDKPILVTKPNTVIMGLGLATIIPTNEDAGMIVSDVGGVSVCGMIFDAGNYSDTLLTVGEEGCNKNHEDNPIVLQDIFYRVGGTGELGRTGSCLVVNSNDVIVDHTWIWRADHGEHTGWYENTADNGLIVNGDNVTAYGLFCEHFQKYDIIWRGEYGSTYFLQNEKCYDPQSQSGWMSHNGTKKGYAAYKVANNVTHHYAVGLGVYDVFINTNGASIYLDNAIEVPDAPDVLIENACIVEIANGSGPKVGINHIINDTTAGIRTGAGNGGGYAVQRLLNYCMGDSVSLDDDYTKNEGAPPVIVEEEGVVPGNDAQAEKDIEKEEKTKDEETPLWEMTEELFDKKIEEAMKELPKEDESDNQEGNDTPGKPGDGENTNGENDSNISTKPEEPNNTDSNSGSGANQNANNNGQVKPQENITASNNSNSNNSNSNNNSNSDDDGNGNGAHVKTVLKKGKKIYVGKYQYTITSLKGKKGNVKLIAVKKKYRKNLKTAKIESSIKYKGYTFKVTAIGKNAFAKSKKLKKITVKGKNLKTISKKAFYKKVRSKLKITAKKTIKKRLNKALGRK